MSTEIFGSHVWQLITTSPLGSLTKRELEIKLISAAVESGLLNPKPEVLAALCKIPLTRAHGYLTDLALRENPLTDKEAIQQLVLLLAGSDVVVSENHFSIPLHNAALRIWLEREMTSQNLNAGDTLRRDHVKLTPTGLVKLIGSADGILAPYDALKKLPKELDRMQWVITAKKSWKKNMTWLDALGAMGNTATVAQAILPAVLIGLGI